MNAMEALGLRADERAVVVHVDDLGLCGDANRGALAALAGAATCGSVMVPCPAFEAIAEVARARPELDLGVHLTLNCEFESYRWQPVHPDVPSLRAPDGGLLRTSEETAQRASARDVKLELGAQIDRALAAGIDVTHLDAHMGTALRPEFVNIYLELAEEYRLPAFVPRVTQQQIQALGMAALWDVYRGVMERAERIGLPLFDHYDANSLHYPPGTGAQHNRARIEQLRPGLTYLITHCAHGSAELESITPDWRQRSEEGQVYSDGSMARVLASEEVVPIGMRPLRAWLRGESARATKARRSG